MGGVSLLAVLLVTLALILVLAGIEDARTREIANWKNAAILLLAPLWWWANGLSLPEIGVQAAIAGVTFMVFVGVFHFGWMGGGDVKMIAALAMWFPLQPLLWMLTVMSLLGGALTVAFLIDQAVRRRSGQIEIPYGVAIAIAALLSLGEPIFNHSGVNV